MNDYSAGIAIETSILAVIADIAYHLAGDRFIINIKITQVIIINGV
jgi:hypothetical protein